jgi:SAM-dependent methyltransferase
VSQLHQDRARAESFGSDAERYDRHRPSYPPELIAWLRIGGPGTAVDVGCGTGQVGQLLLEAGWHVVGVEPDERMAAVARRKGLPVEGARFEDWVPSVRGVDLVCSGQAWHWVDPAIGYSKAAEVLRSGGRLAVFWNAYSYEPQVAAALADVYGRHAPDLLHDSVPLGTADRHNEQDVVNLKASGLFAEAELRSFEHQREQSVTDWLEELLTHSIHSRLDASRVDRLVSELAAALGAVSNGRITVRYETCVATGLLL